MYPSYYQKYPLLPFSSYPEFEYLNQLYPKEIQELRDIVQKSCDKLDYEGSMIYDEYPDKVMFMKLCQDTCAIANYNCAYAKKCTDPERLKDMVCVLMSDELYKRRSRRTANCNSYYTNNIQPNNKYNFCNSDYYPKF